MPGQSAYNATKYAVRGFTEALRQEMLVAGHPVGVTCVHPGGIKTAIARNGRVTAGQDDERDRRRALRPEAGQDDARPRRRDHRPGACSRTRPACLVGLDAHALHHFAKLTGSRYQDSSPAPSSARAEAADRSCRHGRCEVRARAPVRCEMTKWGGRPHWEFDGRYLGSDEHGDWIGFPAGTALHPPGADVRCPNDQVGLVPRRPARRARLAGHLPRPGRRRPAVRRHGDAAGLGRRRAARGRPRPRRGPGRDRRVWVDDEDEFADHRVRSATRPTRRRRAGVLRRGSRPPSAAATPPFDGARRAWLAAGWTWALSSRPPAAPSPAGRRAAAPACPARPCRAAPPPRRRAPSGRGSARAACGSG